MQSPIFYLKTPSILFVVLLFKINKFLPDTLYLKLLYWLTMKKRLNLSNPKTFNEKLQWLKLYDRKSIYTIMVDKFSVKQYVADRIGEEYVIPTLGVWDNANDIEWNKLPEQFVLKTTHGSGGSSVVICKDKSRFNKESAIKKMNWSLKHSDTYAHYKEWPYKNVRKRVIAEKFIVSSGDLKDYKFFCFNGKVRLFKIDFGRFVEHHANYYSPEGKILPFGEEVCTPDYSHEEIMPNNLAKMIELAETLSKDIPFLRVDFYNIDGKILFGELTFFPAGGVGRFTDDKWDKQLGDLLIIPN